AGDGDLRDRSAVDEAALVSEVPREGPRELGKRSEERRVWNLCGSGLAQRGFEQYGALGRRATDGNVRRAIHPELAQGKGNAWGTVDRKVRGEVGVAAEGDPDASLPGVVDSARALVLVIVDHAGDGDLRDRSAVDEAALVSEVPREGPRELGKPAQLDLEFDLIAAGVTHRRLEYHCTLRSGGADGYTCRAVGSKLAEAPRK